MFPDHLLVEVGHHLLEDSISGLICFAELLQDLQRTTEVHKYQSINLLIYESIYPSIRLSVYYLSIFVSFHSWCFIHICNWRHVSVYFQAACQSHMTPTSAVCVCV